MKTIFSFVIVGALLIGIFACEDRDDNLDAPNIRIRNTSNVRFVSVGINNDSVVYENIAADDFSEYSPFLTAFEALPLVVTTDSSTINFVPPVTDLEPLPVGLYTYEIDISEAGEVQLRFKID
ncbi:MAG: hypothetical protein AAF717_14015 [Bacteroidota bacterium]